MKRKTRIILLVSAAGMLGRALALAHMIDPGEPPSISYERWGGREHEIFPLDNTRDEPSVVSVRTLDIRLAEDFVFTMGVGSGMHGLDVFRVDAAGEASYVFHAGGDYWWKAEFRVAATMVARLRQLLVDADYPSLKREYHAAVLDGTQWCVRVDAGGLSKKVYCNNYLPDAAQRLARLVGREILPAHDTAIKKASRIGLPAAQSAGAWLW